MLKCLINNLKYSFPSFHKVVIMPKYCNIVHTVFTSLLLDLAVDIALIIRLELSNKHFWILILLLFYTTQHRKNIHIIGTAQHVTVAHNIRWLASHLVATQQNHIVYFDLRNARVRLYPLIWRKKVFDLRDVDRPRVSAPGDGSRLRSPDRREHSWRLARRAPSSERRPFYRNKERVKPHLWKTRLKSLNLNRLFNRFLYHEVQILWRHAQSPAFTGRRLYFW